MTDLCVNQEETGTSPFSQAFCFSLLVARKVPCDVAYLIYIPFPSPTPFSSSFIRSYFLSSTCPFFPLSSAKRVYEKHRRYRRHLLPSQSLSSLSLSLSSVFPFGGRTHARAPRRRPPSRARTDPLTLSSRRSPPPLPPPSVPTRDSPTYLVQPESLRSRLSAIRPSPVRRRVADSGELPPLRSAPAAIASGERRCGGR